MKHEGKPIPLQCPFFLVLLLTLLTLPLGGTMQHVKKNNRFNGQVWGGMKFWTFLTKKFLKKHKENKYHERYLYNLQNFVKKRYKD